MRVLVEDLLVVRLRGRSISGGVVEGGSTISQQTAKNMFLYSQKCILRKGIELYFTFLLEIIWGKRRILEVYLNIIELGDGVYGVEAASLKYYGISSSQITQKQAIMLASLTTNPKETSVAQPSPYLLRRIDHIKSTMRRSYYLRDEINTYIANSND